MNQHPQSLSSRLLYTPSSSTPGLWRRRNSRIQLEGVYIFLLFSACFFSLPNVAFAEENKSQQEHSIQKESATKQPNQEVKSKALEDFDKDNEGREKAEDSKFSELWSKSLFLLAIAIGALFIATWFMKRMDQFKPKTGGKDAHIHLIEKRMLSQKSCVYLLHIDGHKILVTESINGTQQPYELHKTITDINSI